jgi:hypothetical protein
MVVLRQADIPNDRYWDDTFLSLLLTGKVTSRDGRGAAPLSHAVEREKP